MSDYCPPNAGVPSQQDRQTINSLNSYLYQSVPFECPKEPFRDFVCKPEYNRPIGAGVLEPEETHRQSSSKHKHGEEMCKVAPLVFTDSPADKPKMPSHFPGPCEDFGIPKPCEECSQRSNKQSRNGPSYDPECDLPYPADLNDDDECCQQQPYDDFCDPPPQDEGCNDYDEPYDYSDPCADEHIPCCDDFDECDPNQNLPNPPEECCGCFDECDPNQNLPNPPEGCCNEVDECDPNQNLPNPPEECCNEVDENCDDPPVTALNCQDEILCEPEECDKELPQPTSSDPAPTCDPALCMQLLKESQELLDVYREELCRASSEAYRAAVMAEQQKCAEEIAKYKNALMLMREELIMCQARDSRPMNHPTSGKSMKTAEKQADTCNCWEPKPLGFDPPETQPDECDDGDDDYDECCDDYDDAPRDPPCGPPPPPQRQANIYGMYEKMAALEQELECCRREKHQLEAELSLYLQQYSDSRARYADDFNNNYGHAQQRQAECMAAKKKWISSFRASCQGCNEPDETTAHGDTTSTLRDACHTSLNKIQSVLKSWRAIPPTLSPSNPQSTQDDASDHTCKNWAYRLAAHKTRWLTQCEPSSEPSATTCVYARDPTRNLFCSCPHCIQRKYGAMPHVFEDCDDKGKDSNESSDSEELTAQGERCNLPYFQTDDKGRPIYEGGMSITQFKNYIWKTTDSACDDCSFRSLGIDPEATTRTEGAPETTNPIPYVGGADLERTKNYLWGKETIVEKPESKSKSICKIKPPKEKKC